MLTRPVACLLCCLCLALAVPTRAASDPSPTMDAAVFVLKTATVPSRDRRPHELLKALRHLKDPTLAPLFDALASSRHAMMKVHGVLGLAEIDAQHKLDLARLAAIEQPEVQALIVTSAMDDDLLSDDQAKQILGWKGIDEGVKVLVAAPLIKHKGFEHVDALRKAAESDKLARRALAHLLLMQLDDRASAQAMEQVNQSTDPKRDEVRMMLLRTVMRYKLDRAGKWALQVATEPGVSSRLGLLALHAAMMFNVEGAIGIWRQQYESSTDLADRTRLALIALRLSPQLPPAMFEPMLTSDDAVVKQIGKAGQAIASRQRIANEVVKLVELNHPIANTWAMTYCKENATPEDAAAILLGLVLAFEHGPERGKAQRLDDAMAATELLFEKDPMMAQTLLKPILANPATDPKLLQGLLLGMIRVQNPQVRRMVEGLPPFSDLTARHMALLLLAKHGAPLTAEQQDDLALLVRGGGLPDDSLRAQAAWTWLKLTGRYKAALEQVLAAM